MTFGSGDTTGCSPGFGTGTSSTVNLKSAPWFETTPALHNSGSGAWRYIAMSQCVNQHGLHQTRQRRAFIRGHTDQLI